MDYQDKLHGESVLNTSNEQHREEFIRRRLDRSSSSSEVAMTRCTLSSRLCNFEWDLKSARKAFQITPTAVSSTSIPTPTASKLKFNYAEQKICVM